MHIRLVRATPGHVSDYIRIARQVKCRLNCVATTLTEVFKEMETSIVHMILVDGQTVGFISYIYKFERPRYLHISEVQIEPAFQSRGVGRLSLEYVIAMFPKVELFELYTHPESQAQYMFARHGFRATGEISENHRGTGEPRIRMILERKAE